MSFRTIVIALVLVTLSAGPASGQLLPALGSERSGTSGFQFLKIPVDARSASLGQAVVASGNDVGALFWNPALAAWGQGVRAGLYHTAYFVDVTVDYAGVIWPLSGSGITLGASLQTLNSGAMDVTTELQPFGTGQTFRLLDMAAGLSVSQRLTDLFSYGVTTKLVRESVAGLTATTVVFDLGFFYAVGNTGVQFAVAIRNFGLDGTPKGTLDRPVIGNPPVVTEEDFEALTPPTTFHLGVAYDLLKNRPQQQLVMTLQLDNPSDNAETWSTGLEWGWRETLFLRSGYRFGLEEQTIPAVGAGIRVPISGTWLRFDYGYNRLERLGAVHRLGLHLTL